MGLFLMMDSTAGRTPALPQATTRPDGGKYDGVHTGRASTQQHGPVPHGARPSPGDQLETPATGRYRVNLDPTLDSSQH